MAKRQKAKPTLEEQEEDIWPDEKSECNHKWHLVRYIENPFFDKREAVFICSSCGKINRIEGKE
jgi:hypothetical protein